MKTIFQLPLAHAGAVAEKSAESGKFSWRQELLYGMAFLAIALTFAFFPIIFNGKTTLYSAQGTATIMPYGAYGNTSKISVDSLRTTDAGAPAWAAEPWMKLTQHLLYDEHNVPLWNAYSGCGAPFLANMQSQVLTPLNVLLSSFASPLAYDIFVLSRLLLGGVLAYCAARLWTSPACSMVAGLIFMLCGYHLGLANMSEISVSMMLPAVFAATELVIRRQNFSSIVLCALSVASVLYGGMPELAFLVLLFTSVYAAFRLFSANTATARIKLAGLLATAYLAGLALAAPQVIPFVEYMRLSHNLHDPSIMSTLSGLTYEWDWQRGLLTYLIPGALKVPNFNVNFWGISATFLSLLAACAAINSLKLRQQQSGALAPVTLFLFTAAVLMICKRFGMPLVQYFGALPVANMVIFPKYDEPLISLCIALLSAFALKAISSKSIGNKTILSCAVALTASVGYLLYAYRMIPHTAALDARACLNGGVVSAAITLITLVTALLMAKKRPAIFSAMPFLVATLFVAEITCGYLTRAHFADSSFASQSADPYAGAPYIKFLQSKTASNHERIFATDYLLLSNWSAAFQLADMRALDAIYPNRYFNFVSNFYPGAQAAGELYDRFFGSESSVIRQMRSPAERQLLFHRLCALTSTAYVATVAALPVQTNLLDVYALSNSANGRTFKKEIEIDGKKLSVLFQRAEPSPNQTLLKASILVPKQWPYLRVGMLPNPDVSDGFRPGEGVYFDIYASAPQTGLQRLLHEHVTSANTDNGKARLQIVDLKRFAGQRIELRLSSNTLSKEPTAASWVAWSQLGWCNEHGQIPATEIDEASERLVYDGQEAKVYAIAPVLPRAAIFTDVKVVPDDQAALSLLAADSFNPFNSALLERDDLPQPHMNLPQLPAPCSAATITKYSGNQIKIICAPKQPSLLVLNDMYYPGWTAFVDGKPSKILQANYCFRGVLLQPGDHSIEFLYDPISFRLGLWLAAITVGLIVSFGLVIFRKRAG